MPYGDSDLEQVLADCLSAPSFYLNQSQLIIREVLWYLSKGNFTPVYTNSRLQSQVLMS